MKKSRISENKVLKARFRDAYFAREREDIGDAWSNQTMKQIRRIGPLGPGSTFWPAFEHLVWRLAPVMCLLVIALTFFFLTADSDPGQDYMSMWTVDRESQTLSELFGFEG
jgi:hypothetical protein